MPTRQPTPVEPRTASERLLVRLDRIPRFIPILAVVALVVIGAVVPTFGWIATVLVVAFLIWMLALSWPRLTSVEKLMRIAVIVFVAAVALIQSRPR